MALLPTSLQPWDHGEGVYEKEDGSKRQQREPNDLHRRL
jgi:hypothetical protein